LKSDIKHQEKEYIPLLSEWWYWNHSSFEWVVILESFLFWVSGDIGIVPLLGEWWYWNRSSFGWVMILESFLFWVSGDIGIVQMVWYFWFLLH